MDGAGLAGNIVATLGAVRAATTIQSPQFDAEAWLQIIILIVALLLAAIASAAETAFTSVSRIKLKNQVEAGDEKAKKIEQLLAQPNVFLSTILVVNNVAVIVACTMATVPGLPFPAHRRALVSKNTTSLVCLVFCAISAETCGEAKPS